MKFYIILSIILVSRSVAQFPFGTKGGGASVPFGLSPLSKPITTVKDATQAGVKRGQDLVKKQIEQNISADISEVLASATDQVKQLVAKEWGDFTTTFKKVYPTEAERKLRLKTFVDNRDKLLQLNKQIIGKSNFLAKINEFADMTLKEFTDTFNGFNRSTSKPTMTLKPAMAFDKPNAAEAIPESIDWTKKGAIGPVKSQGNCAACWAFSAAGALEAHQFKKTGKLVEVSAQNLIDCSTPYGNNGCSGGTMNPAFMYISNNKGVDSETSYPFEAKNGECRFKRPDTVANCQSFIDLPENDEKALEVAVGLYGPVTAAIDANQPTFQFYSEGIYDDPKCGNKPEQMNHAVLIVGYGKEDDGRKYWLVKNTYGPNWGLKGYVKIAKNNNNQCGIAIQASYPLVL